MAYPPSVPPADRLDTTPLPTNHHDDHNDISLALTDIINELGSAPKGSAASVTARFDGIGLVYHGTGTQAFTALQASTDVTIDTEVFDIGTVGAVGSAVLTAPTDGLYVLVLAGSRSAGTGEVNFAATVPSANSNPGFGLTVAATKRLPVSFWLSSGDTMSLRGSEALNAAATITFDVKLYRIA